MIQSDHMTMILQAHQSNRVCNALALLQCVASHPETRSAFLTGTLASHHKYHNRNSLENCNL